MNLLNGMFIAMSPQGAEGGGGSPWPMMIMFGMIIVIMYFMIIRPQQKRQKEHQKMLSEIKKSDKVVLSSGLHGTVSEVKESTMVVQIADNVRVEVEKSSVAAKK
jgi:preprotein translocase subunit YajC